MYLLEPAEGSASNWTALDITHPQQPKRERPYTIGNTSISLLLIIHETIWTTHRYTITTKLKRCIKCFFVIHYIKKWILWRNYYLAVSSTISNTEQLNILKHMQQWDNAVFNEENSDGHGWDKGILVLKFMLYFTWKSTPVFYLETQFLHDTWDIISKHVTTCICGMKHDMGIYWGGGEIILDLWQFHMRTRSR